MKSVIVLFLSSFLISSCQSNAQNSGYQNINAKEMESMMKQKDVLVIDVRTDGEVRQGYLDETDYFIDAYKPNFDTELDKLDKNKTYIVYCRSGARSSTTAQKLTAKGFKKVYNLSGGMNRWTNSSHVKTK